MAGPRTYGEACAAAHALDLIGERWALLVVRELLLGPKRFTDLRAGIVHASPNVLAQRLRELEEAGVVRRRKLPPPAASRVYELTEWGQELEPVVTGLGRWGARSPLHRRDIGMSVDSHILAMRTMFDPDLAAGLDVRIALKIGEEEFLAEVTDGKLLAERGSADAPDATIVVDDPGTLLGLIFEGESLEDALAAGQVAIEGDKQVAERFLGLFPLPAPVAA